MRRHEENARELAEFLEQEEEIADVLYPGKGGIKLSTPPRLSAKQIVFSAFKNGLTHSSFCSRKDNIRIANGVCNRLLRFSVGIEHAEDLKRDVKQALQSRDM
jgi:cystathionine gamma-synthase